MKRKNDWKYDSEKKINSYLKINCGDYGLNKAESGDHANHKNVWKKLRGFDDSFISVIFPMLTKLTTENCILRKFEKTKKI